MDSCWSVFFTAVAFLHVAYKSISHGLNDELMEVLATLFGQIIDRRHYSHNSTSLLSLVQAANMMKVASLSTRSLIAIELSKAYLYRTLNCEDSDSDSIYCLANVYLAVLYYTTEQYQTAIDHCTLVMRSQDHSQCSSHVVQGELLPKIDDNIDIVLGLAVFYQHVRTAALNQHHRTEHAGVMTGATFASYLHIKCISSTMRCRFTRTNEFTQYVNRIRDITQLFIGDVLLFVSLNRFFNGYFSQKPILHHSHQLTTNPVEYNASNLVALLQKSAIQHLTTFRQIEARNFGSVATTVTTDFEVLYAFKRGDYQRCLQCLHRTYTRCGMLSTCPEFKHFRRLFSCWMTTLSH